MKTLEELKQSLSENQNEYEETREAYEQACADYVETQSTITKAKLDLLTIRNNKRMARERLDDLKREAIVLRRKIRDGASVTPRFSNNEKVEASHSSKAREFFDSIDADESE